VAREPHRLQHRLGVLQLVTQDELVEHRVRAPLVEHLERACADVVEVAQRAGVVEELDAPPHAARGLERVVHGGELAMQQLPPAVAVHEPEVLVRRDVRQVPHERAHHRVDLALEVVGGEGSHEGEGACADGGEVLDEAHAANPTHGCTRRPRRP
jgi:hypothetical protein